LIRVFVEGVGVAGPGLQGWTIARGVLAGLAPYQPTAFVPPPVALLPPAERRRAGAAVRLAIAVGCEALAEANRDPAAMAMVFTSSSSDVDTVHEILCVLATDGREVSPTRFHNSVHNAPAGYWAVATGSCEPSTSLCAHDASFSAGLWDAAAQVIVEDRPVTLAAYDLPYPEPLNGARPIEGLFAAAMVLTPKPTERTFASLTIKPENASAAPSAMTDPSLERLRLGNPAARGLPLLAALATGRSETIHLHANSGTGAEILVEPV
jgi:Beta-ketoacyl synthase, N-terminal domain